MRPSLAALLLVLGLVSCGGEGSDFPPLPSGAPWLRRAGGPVRPFGGDATLTLASPARVRILYRRDGVEERTVFDARVPGSQLVEISYTALPRARAVQVDPLPPVGDQGADRTEIHGFTFHVTVEGQLGDLTVEPSVWTRPGRAKARVQAMVPTRLGEVLPLDSEVELAVIAVADLEGGELTLQRKSGWTVARADPPMGPEDRLHLLRLILRVESVGDGRSETP